MNRKTLGEIFTLSPAEVTAGSNQDFTITYKATETLMGSEDDAGQGQNPDVIEVKLPDGWDAPTAYQLDEDKT